MQVKSSTSLAVWPVIPPRAADQDYTNEFLWGDGQSSLYQVFIFLPIYMTPQTSIEGQYFICMIVNA